MNAVAVDAAARSRGTGAWPVLLQLLAISAVSVLAAVLWQQTESEAWWLPLLLGTAIAFGWAWRRIDWGDVWHRYLSFGAVVLLAAVFNRLLYLADYGLNGLPQWPFFEQDTASKVIRAEWMTVVGTILTVLAWGWTGGMRVSIGELLALRGRRLYGLLIFTYAVSLAAVAVQEVVPQVASALGQLLPALLGLGSGMAFFLPILMTTSASRRLAIALLMSLPFIVVSVGVGMKEAIILAIAPLAYLGWTGIRNAGARALMLGVGFAVLAAITAYVGFYREQAWYAGREVTRGEVLAEFSDEVRAQGALPTLRRGSVDFLRRGNAAEYRGWPVSIYDTDGAHPELALAPLAYVWIPRALWPEKPEIRQGWEFTALVFGDAEAAGNGSSLSAGLYPALYLGYGWTAVVLGALLVGAVVGWMSRLAQRIGGPVLAGLYGVSLLPYALRLDETWPVGALSGPILTLGYVTALYFAARFGAGLLARRSAEGQP